MALPDFLVAGVPKAGTTALHAALVRHPQLFLPTVKEPKFFLTDGPPPARGGPGDAADLPGARLATGRLRGAVRPGAAGHAARRGDPVLPVRPGGPPADPARWSPRRRSSCMLRDPVDRAHSNWSHLWSAGLEPEARLPRGRARRAGAPGRRVGGFLALHRPRAGTASSSQHLLGVFPREQVLVLRYRDLRERPGGRSTRSAGSSASHRAADRRSRRRTSVVTSPTRRSNAALRAALRLGGEVGHRFPEPVRQGVPRPPARGAAPPGVRHPASSGSRATGRPAAPFRGRDRTAGERHRQLVRRLGRDPPCRRAGLTGQTEDLTDGTERPCPP